LDWDRSDIAEFKTSRSFKEPKNIGELDIYLEQVQIYMAAKNMTEAKLWVLYLNLRDEKTRKTTPTFRCFHFRISPEDLAKLKEWIKTSVADLKEAIARSDWKRLPLCRDWLCGRAMCAWYDKCQPEERYGTREFDGE
jgi:hypothetical protein